MITLIELALTIWAALSVKMINRQVRWGLYSGTACNMCFLTYWFISEQHGFLIGDIVFTLMYWREIWWRFKNV